MDTLILADLSLTTLTVFTPIVFAIWITACPTCHNKTTLVAVEGKMKTAFSSPWKINIGKVKNVLTALFAPFWTTQSPGARSTKSSNILPRKKKIQTLQNQWWKYLYAVHGLIMMVAATVTGMSFLIWNRLSWLQIFSKRKCAHILCFVQSYLYPCILMVDHMRPPSASHRNVG